MDGIMKHESDRKQNEQEPRTYGHRPRKKERNRQKTNARHSQWHHDTANLSQQKQRSITKHNQSRMKFRITETQMLLCPVFLV